MRYIEKKISGNFTARKMSVAMAVLLFGTICLLPRAGMAQVSGSCVNCHTMHNSQGGLSMNADISGATTGTVYRSLTRSDCVGCHTGTSANDLTDLGIPKVNHTVPPSSTLAGGSFYWVGTDNLDANGHNILGISGVDNALGIIPPGYPSGGLPRVQQLTCAGRMGCHGNRTIADEYASISGSHHAPKQYANGYKDGLTPVVGSDSSVGNSYRFLLAIKGIGDPLWEKNPSATTHNQYYGGARTTDDVNDYQTISRFCGKCHYDFHASLSAHDDTSAPTVGISYANNMTSPWIRHPTDFDMNTVKAKEYGAYGGGVIGTGGGAYVPQAPVASNFLDETSVPKAVVMVAAGDAIVTCISCHRAHGSDQPDMLRWNYSKMKAHQTTTGNTGCFTCHTTKDT